LVGDIGRRRGKRRKERRNIVELKHTLTPGESINVSHRKGQRVTALGNH
jgi:hypothetical protein